MLGIQVYQRHQQIRLSDGKRIVALGHIFERVPCHVQIHGFEMQEEELSPAFLVEMAPCQLGNVYKKGVNNSA